MFLVFVNDLPAVVTSSLALLFADDAKCIKSIYETSDCLSLQQDLNNLATWSTSWNLLFNEEKCSVVRFYSNNSPLLYNYYLNCKLVATKSTHSDLGVVVSSDLQWKCHYLSILSPTNV